MGSLLYKKYEKGANINDNRLFILKSEDEEKWLYNLYGYEYKAYCKKVNRCIPWFPKNN